MQQFELELKNEKIKSYNRISLIAIIINALIFVYFLYTSGDKNVIRSSWIGISVIFLGLIYIYFQEIYKLMVKIRYFNVFLLLGICWLTLYNYWASGIMLLFGILSSIAVRKFTVILSDKKISYPSFPRRSFQWGELSNVVLRDGVLTIDLKNNKLIQQYTEKTLSGKEEKEFNEFCRKQLDSATAPD